MGVIFHNPALTITLQAAVPLHIHELSRYHPATRERVRHRWAADGADHIAHKGDALQFGGKRGEAGRAFAALARGLAAAAFQPGGVTFAGLHWCVDHAACVEADRDAAAQPFDTAEPQPVQPTGPTFRGRPVATVTLPEVA